MTHEYLFQNKRIYFIVVSKAGLVEKKIPLCKDVNECTFYLDNNNLTTSVTIEMKTFNHNFNIRS